MGVTVGRDSGWSVSINLNSTARQRANGLFIRNFTKANILQVHEGRVNLKDSLMPTFEASSLIERICYAACMPAMVLWMFTQSEGHRIEQAPGQPGVKRLLINKFGQIDEVGAVHYWLSTHGFIWLPAILFLGLIACGSARRRSDRL